MKFTVSNRELLRVLKAVGAVILKKNTLPILGNTLFTQKGDKFVLTGSSLENTLTMPIDLILQAGETFTPFCLNATDVMPLLASLAEQPITVDVSLDNHQAKFSYQGGEVSLPIEGTEDYPKMADMTTPTVKFSIATNIFLPAVKAASTCTAQDELRPVMAAVALDVKVDGVTFVGTDGHSLYKYVFYHGAPFLSEGNEDIILLPANVVGALDAPFAGAEEITVIHDGKHVCIEHDNVTFTIRDIEGRYPNYNSVIPQNNPYHAILPVASLKAALGRVRLMASDNSKLVKLAKEEMFVTLSADDLDFSRSAHEDLTLAEVEKACTMPTGFAIGFDYSRMVKLLNTISTDNVRVEMSDPSRAMLIKEDAENSALTELLMPMKLEG